MLMWGTNNSTATTNSTVIRLKPKKHVRLQNSGHNSAYSSNGVSAVVLDSLVKVRVRFLAGTGAEVVDGSILASPKPSLETFSA